MSDNDGFSRLEWEERAMKFKKYDSCKLLARGGMGAAFCVVKKANLSKRCLKLSLDNDNDTDALKEDSWLNH